MYAVYVVEIEVLVWARLSLRLSPCSSLPSRSLPHLCVLAQVVVAIGAKVFGVFQILNAKRNQTAAEPAAKKTKGSRTGIHRGTIFIVDSGCYDLLAVGAQPI